MSALDKENSIPFWKKIYQTASGYSSSITNDIVEEILKMTRTELINGYTIYTPYSEGDFTTWEKSFVKHDSDINHFLKRLCKTLNLAPDVGLPTFFNYLMFEYYGKIEEIKLLIQYEHNILRLLENVSQFYGAERMYYIKTLRHIFECAADEKCEFISEYKDFIKSLDIVEFRSTLIKELEGLISEIRENTLAAVQDKAGLVNRNNREQLEFLLLIITTTEHVPLLSTEMRKLIDIFLIHNFTRQPVFFDCTLYGNEVDFNDVKCAEIGCFLIGMNQIGNAISSLPDTLESAFKDVQTQGDHSVVLFAWTIAKLKALTDNNRDDEKKYENVIRILLGRNIFCSLNNFISSNVLKAKLKACKLILLAAFKLLDEFLRSFESKKLLLRNAGIMSCVQNLLSVPECAENTLLARDGVDLVLKMAFDVFPCDFVTLTKFSQVLITHEHLSPLIIDKLNNLNIYAERRPPSGRFSEKYIPIEDVYAYNFNENLTFPPEAGQTIDSVYESILQVSQEFSYFSQLAQMTLELIEIHRDLNMTYANQVEVGFDLIYAIIISLKGNVQNYNIKPIDTCMELLGTFINLVSRSPLTYFGLVKIFFKIHTAMIINHNSTIDREFPVTNVTKQFLPKLQIQEITPETLTQKGIIDSILFQALRKEEFEVDHSMLILYLEFVQNFVKVNEGILDVQLPGLVYVMNFVFPFHKNWNYTSKHEQVKISTACLRLFLTILENDSYKTKLELALRDFIKNSLLRNSSILDSFLQFLFKNTYQLQTIMQNEVDWLKGDSLGEITLSKLHLRVFLHLMADDNLQTSELLKSRLPTITKCIASLITNAYSSSLANLACMMVDKISQDKTIPVLALLEMDYSQIQCLFLEKLRDPLEDDAFKISALNLINTSLRSQNGLTAAFFNAPDMKFRSKKEKAEDSVSDFMIDYLHNIQKSHDYLENPVQKSILRVFCTLWQTGREDLVNDIYCLKRFWPLLADPLFHPFNIDMEVYTYLMTIITIHINGNRRNVDENLKQVLSTFFGDENLINHWIEYIKSVTNKLSEKKFVDSLHFVIAWQKFLITVKNYVPQVIKQQKVKSKLILSCLKGLLWHFSSLSIHQTLTIFSDLYLILIFSWSEAYVNEIETIELLTEVLKVYITKCAIVTIHNREVFLTMLHKTLKDLKSILETHPIVLQGLLKYIGVLVDFEFQQLTIEHDNIDNKVRSIMCWVLVARVGDSILSLKNVEQHALFFKYHQYLAKMLESTRFVLSDVQTLPMVKMLMETLITYAESDIAIDFLSENIMTVYDIVYPSRPVFPKAGREQLPLYLKEQWILYAMVIKLNHILLKKFGEKMLEANFTFITVYDKVFAEMICLPEDTVDSKGLDLSCETLHYLYTLLEWGGVWSSKHEASFSLIVSAIKRTINSCISTILRPENIHFYNINKLGKLNSMDEVPDAMLVDVIDRYMELLCLATRCLIKCNPPIQELFNLEKPKVPLYILVEHDFTVPKFDIPVTNDLTYGRLLCMVQFLRKALNQKPTATKPTIVKSPTVICSTEMVSIAIKKKKTLAEIFGQFTMFAENFIGFIEYPKSSDIAQPKKLSALLHYGFQALTDPWLKDINREKVQFALEYLMVFLGTQVFFHVNILKRPHLHYFKRELYSELQFFDKYVKELTTEELSNIGTLRKSDSTYQSQVDYINKLMVNKLLRKKDNFENTHDKYILFAISKWFINFCDLS